MENIDIQAVGEIRERLRRALPKKDGQAITDEFLSGAFGLTTELITLRIVQDLQRAQGRFLSVQEAELIQKDISEAISKAISDVVLKYIPDAVVFYNRNIPKGTE